MRSTVPGHQGGKTNGGDHAARVCLPCARKIVGRPVIGGCPHNGKPEAHVYGLMKVDQLDGDQPLVMVHGDHGIEFTLVHAVKQCIGGKGAGHGIRQAFEALNNGSDHVPFLPPEPAFFACVGIEAGDGQAWSFESEIPQKGMRRDADGSNESVRCEEAGDVGNGMVDGHERNAKARAGKHHDHILRPREVFQEFRVAGKWKSESMEIRLVDRARADGVHVAVHGEADGLLDPAHNRAAGGFRGLPVHDVVVLKFGRADDQDVSIRG